MKYRVINGGYNSFSCTANTTRLNLAHREYKGIRKRIFDIEEGKRKRTKGQVAQRAREQKTKCRREEKMGRKTGERRKYDGSSVERAKRRSDKRLKSLKDRKRSRGRRLLLGQRSPASPQPILKSITDSVELCRLAGVPRNLHRTSAQY